MLLESLQQLLLEKRFDEWVSEQEEKTGMHIHNMRMFQKWFASVLGSEIDRLDNYTIPEVNRLVKAWRNRPTGAKAYHHEDEISEMTSSGGVGFGVNQRLGIGNKNGLVTRPGLYANQTAVDIKVEKVNKRFNKKAPKKARKKIKES